MKYAPSIIACCLACASCASAAIPLSGVIDRAVRDGVDATRPGPLSKALGVSRREGPMPARQLQLRSGHTAHADVEFSTERNTRTQGPDPISH